MRDKQQNKPLDVKAANPSARLVASASWRTALLAQLAVAVAGCGSAAEQEIQTPDGPGDAVQDTGGGEAERLARAVPDSVMARWGLPDGAVARLGRGTMEGYAFTPDGRSLVISSGVGLWYYDIATGEPVALEAKGMPPEGEEDATDGTVFQDMRWMSFKPGLDVRSQDGATLANAMGDTVRVRDVATGAIRFEERVEEPVRALAYWAEPFTLAVASGSDIIVWRDRRGEGIQQSTLAGEAGYARALTILAGGSRLASAYIDQDSGEIRLWDLERERAEGVRALLHPEGYCCLDWGNMAFSPDGSMLAAGGFETVFLWDVATGQWRGRLEDIDASANIVAIAFSPDGTTVGTRWNNDPGHIRLWDAASGAFRDIGSEEHLPLAPIGISTDGSTLATLSQWDASFSYEGWRSWGGQAGVTQFWDTRTGERYNTVISSPHELAISPDFQIVASTWWVESRGDVSGAVELYNIRTGGEVQLSHGNSIESVAFSPDGRIVASWMHPADGVEEFDETIRLWDVATGDLLLATSADTVVSLEDPETDELIATVSNGSVMFARAAPPPKIAAFEVSATPDGDTVWLSSDREVEATAFGGSIMLQRAPFDTPRDPDLAAMFEAAMQRAGP